MSQVVGTLDISYFDGRTESLSLLDGQTLNIGREAANDIVLDEAGVSRLHASFSASSRGVVVADSGSTNGVFLNGDKLVSMRDLDSGDIVDVGSTKFILKLLTLEQAAAESQDVDSRLTAQMKTISVAVLVSTVQDYFQISENVATNDVVQMLMAWSGRVREVIAQNGGVVDKIIGSSIVSLWSGENASTQAQGALDAAKEIQDLSAELAQGADWPHQETFPWVATSVLTMGRGLAAEGAEEQFSLLGDPINSAFELEALFHESDVRLLVNSDVAELSNQGSLTELSIKHKDKSVYSLSS